MNNFFEELCSKLNIEWSDIQNNDLYSETELTRWLTLAKQQAEARHPWQFTEGRHEITSVAGQEKYDVPTHFKTGRLRYATVNDKRYTKMIFEEYMRHLEDYADSTSKIFSERNRIMYFNYNATDFGNSIVVYGQVEVTGSVSSATTSTVFTAGEPEADEAIIKLGYSYALSSDKNKEPARSRLERAEAFEILDGIWKRMQEKRHTYQTREEGGGFDRLNILRGGYYSDIRRDRF